MPHSNRPATLVLILLGVAAGFLSGLFGVGGGVILVPAFMMLGMSQRIAAGTSVTAILPTSAVGAAGYAISGNIDWLAGLLLAIGAVGGAQLGTYLLHRIPRDALFWTFLAFLAVVIVSLWFVVPQRDDVISIDVLSGAGLILTGVVVGTLSGLLGIGGGIVVVPVLMFFFGASDLIAKGTSLLMMVPGSISATIGNARRHNVDLRSAAVVGISACIASPLGILLAAALPPLWSNIAFSALIVAIAIQLVVSRRSGRRR